MGDVLKNFAKRYPLIWSLFTERLKMTLTALAALFVLTAYPLYAVMLASSDGLFTKHGPIIGADFFVFYNAAKLAGEPQMSEIYEMERFSALLRDIYPGRGDMLFGWQYPPTMSLLVKPLAYLSYLPAFALWVAAFFVLFVGALSRIWKDKVAIFIAIASPAVFYSIITGQTGLLTASLFALAVYFAGTRPLVAGAAAALLTIKPQFGLLLPLVFIAGGHWRTFFYAAAGAIILAGASILPFGVEPWRAFVEAVTVHGGRMGADNGFPAYKLISPFGAASVLGISKGAALAFHAACATLITLFVVHVWRKTDNPEIRLASTATAAALVTPYAFFYEAAFLVPPMFAVAKHAVQNGWLKGEKVMLIAVWSAALFMPGPDAIPAFPVSFSVAALAFLLSVRRSAYAVSRFAKELPDPSVRPGAFAAQQQG